MEKVGKMTTSEASAVLQKILEKDGRDFIRACFRDILLRESSAEDEAIHLPALAKGRSKIWIAASIANSDEACLKNTAASSLGQLVRYRAFMERNVFLGPMRKSLASRAGKTQTARLEQRRAILLENSVAQPSDKVSGKPGNSLESVSPVRLQRIAAKDWRTKIAESRGLNTMKRSDGRINTLWFDLTTTFQWSGGVVGIVRAELEIACGLARLCPEIRFSMEADQGFVEIEKSELRWLLDAENVTDAYMHFFARYKNSENKPKTISVNVPDTHSFFHPYEDRDVVISTGWIDSKKERYFSLVRNEIPTIRLHYLVYDIIMLLDEAKHFHSIDLREKFTKYIKWISYNCDLIFYGGDTARIDTQALQRAEGWPVPPGVPVKFGTDIVKKGMSGDDMELLKKFGISGEYIITVGSFEPRKNHETLYRAYLLALESADGPLPQFIFVGNKRRHLDFLDIMALYPALEGKLICVSPTDAELAVLYQHCRFTLLASLYEGWSLTLPESLAYGKFCLCSDTPPLREIGRDLVDYIDPFDARGWAEKIIMYASDDKLLRARERKIAKEWVNTSWLDTARMLLDTTLTAADATPAVFDQPPVIWMDLTLSYLLWEGGIQGIIRAELEYAKQLKAQDPRTRFFAYQPGWNHFFEIDESYLTWLFSDHDISDSYKHFHEFWAEHERQGTAFRNPFRNPGLDGNAQPYHSAYINRFPHNSIVFFAGINFNVDPKENHVSKIEGLINANPSIMRSHIVYDLTPFLTPQFHIPETCAGFRVLFEYLSNHFDHIVYGGRTARRDGIVVQQREGWKTPASDFVEFGADINASGSGLPNAQEDAEILRRMGISADFAITVGTIQPRKNHEVLYKAYLTILKKEMFDKPFQIVFVGKNGWKANDLVSAIEQDVRIKGKILIVSPTDKELDVLYRHCKFTLLPSFYEGWSLTLPESLSYGKLCLTSDVDPLRETGEDLVEYIHPLDTVRWAERIAFYANNPDKLKPWEDNIKAHWKARTWRESAEMLVDVLRRAHHEILTERNLSSVKEDV